jgi:plastocyanin
MPANVFVPFLVQVARGATVTWRFGAAPHNAIFVPATGAPADIPIVSNVDVARTFPTPGTFRYDCTIHPGMNGVVEVKP